MPDSQNRLVLAAVVALLAVGAVGGLLLTGGVLSDGSSGDTATPTDDAASAGVEPGDGNGSVAVESTPSPTPASGGSAIDEATSTPSPEPATATPTPTETPEDDDDSSSNGPSSTNPSSGSPSSSNPPDGDDDDGTDGNDGNEGSDGNDGDSAPSYTVAADGSAEYESIQAAVDDASDGGNVTVAPGTYEEQVRLAKNVSLVAPEEATLRGDGLDANESVAIEIADADGPVAPTVAGFDVRGYERGVVAKGTRGDWTLRNLFVANSTIVAVNATRSTGDWTLNGTAVDGAPRGVAAANASGDWTIRNASVTNATDTAILANDTTGDWTLAEFAVPGSPVTAISTVRSTGDWAVRNGTVGDARTGVDARNASGAWRLTDVHVYDGQTGLLARHTTGDWAVAGGTLARHEYDAIGAAHATGNWSVRGTEIRDGEHGVYANQAGGNWTIRNASLRDTELAGVRAAGTDGAWTVTNSEFLNHSGTSIVASGASTNGNATHNWWGSPDGPAEGDCVDAVDCSDPLASPPGIEPVSMNVRSPFTSTWSSGFSQHPTVEFDRPVAFENGSRYELVVRDEDAGGELIVEPPVNETVTPPPDPGPNESVDPNDTVGTSLGLSVPHPTGDHGERSVWTIFGLPSEHANVTTAGEVTTRGVANLSVALRRAETGDTLSTTSSRPYLLGWQAGYEQNSTNGTVQIAVNRSTLPAGTNVTATVYDADATDHDGTDDRVELNLTYEPGYEARTDRVDDGAFVATFDADRLDGGAYDVFLDGRLPEPYEITFSEAGHRPFEIDRPAPR